MDETKEPEKANYIVGEQDWMLQLLVKIVSSIELGGDGHVSIGLTVVCGGTIISGQLTKADEYFKRFGEAFADGLRRSGSDETSAARVAKLFPENAKKRIEYAMKLLPEGEELPFHYLHLVNARIIYRQGALPEYNASSDNSLWRGKISSVDAFMLGTFGPSER
jgi:hypothetical protein